VDEVAQLGAHLDQLLVDPPDHVVHRGFTLDFADCYPRKQHEGGVLVEPVFYVTGRVFVCTEHSLGGGDAQAFFLCFCVLVEELLLGISRWHVGVEVVFSFELESIGLRAVALAGAESIRVTLADFDFTEVVFVVGGVGIFLGLTGPNAPAQSQVFTEQHFYLAILGTVLETRGQLRLRVLFFRWLHFGEYLDETLFEDVRHVGVVEH